MIAPGDTCELKPRNHFAIFRKARITQTFIESRALNVGQAVDTNPLL